MGEDCTYCGRPVANHDPVYVAEPTDCDREFVGAFCNYSCLLAHIEREDLAVGASCAWEPGE